MNEFYNYIYLDPRKPGNYTYDNISFLYEPIYVGKGKNNRYLDHIYDDHRNKLKANVIEKILKEGYNLERYILIIQNDLTENQAFINEKKLIKEIGRRITKDGSLCNMDEGGKGSDTISHHPNREEIINKIRRSGEDHWAYHKSYKELYGNKALEQCNKRSNALKGKKHSKERKENIRKGHLGLIPWNKGLDKNDPRVLKNINNRKPRKFFKKYKIKNIETNETYIFNGKKEFSRFIKTFNKDLKNGFKTNIDILIKEEQDKNFILTKELDKWEQLN